MNVDRLLRWFGVLSAVAVPAAVQAQGFQLNEIGSCAVSRAAAVTGAPCRDASVIFWNPAAGSILANGWSVQGGVTRIAISGDFTQDTSLQQFNSTAKAQLVPELFVNYKSGGRWTAGIGAYVPYGLTSQWGDDFPGRFEAVKSAISTIYVQPNISFEIVPGKWSIGGGPVIGNSTVELRQALDLSTQLSPFGVTFAQLGVAPGTEFARAILKGSATGYGFHLGVFGHLTPSLTLGARYLSSIKFKYDHATATFDQIPTGIRIFAPAPYGTILVDTAAAEYFVQGPLVRQGAKTEITHPAQVEVGLGWTGLAGTTLSLDWEMTNWSSFGTLPLSFTGPMALVGANRTLIEDYKNSQSIRGSVSHTVAAGFAAGWDARLGFSYVTAAAPDVTVTPLLPDMNRMNYGLGLGIPFGPAVGLDLGALIVDTNGRRGRIVERTSSSQTAAQLNGGFYRLGALILSAGLKASF